MYNGEKWQCPRLCPRLLFRFLINFNCRVCEVICMKFAECLSAFCLYLRPPSTCPNEDPNLVPIGKQAFQPSLLGQAHTAKRIAFPVWSYQFPLHICRPMWKTKQKKTNSVKINSHARWPGSDLQFAEMAFWQTTSHVVQVVSLPPTPPRIFLKKMEESSLYENLNRPLWKFNFGTSGLQS